MIKNISKLIILSAIVIALSVACKKSDRTNSLSVGCLTPDGKKVGVGTKGKAFVIDAEDGKIIKDLDVTRKEGAIVCSPKNEVFVVYSDEIVNIETSETYPRRKAVSTIIGINSKGNLVGHQNITNQRKRGEELELFVEQPFDQTDDLKPIRLPLESLGAVQRNISSFLTKPAKLLDNNKLLIFAGGKARTIPASEEEDFDPDIWGFYTVDLESGVISPTKVTDKEDELANLFNPPLVDATADGKVFASTFSNTSGKIGLVYNGETGEEIFRNGFYRNGEKEGRSSDQIKKFQAIALSKDGKKLAVAGEWDISKGRLYEAQTAVMIYDLTSGDRLSKYEYENKIIDIISFSDNELIIDFKNQSIAKVNTKDGKNIWIKQLVKQR